jgi:HK97 family phage portal protein
MANIFSRIFSKKNTEERGIYENWQDPILGTLSFNGYSSFNQSKSLKLSTVYRCVNLVSDSIASLPLYPYVWNGNWKNVDETNTLYNLLNVQPNSFMGAYMFKKLMIVNMLLKGNAYILVDRLNSGAVLSLTLLNSDFVQVYVNGQLITAVTDFTALGSDLTITYLYTLTGKEYDKSQIVHIPNYTVNGIEGISTLSYASDTLGLASYTNEHSSNFFKGGSNLAGILRPVAGGTLLKGQATKAKQDFINALSPVVGGVSGGIVALDAGLEYQSITVNPKDSQMIENKAFSVLEICRYFGVPPSLAFSETQKYSTAEQQALDFLNNGLLPVIEKLENELYRKLFLPSEWPTTDLKFDVENLIRLDAVTKADVLIKLIGAGVKTPNEAREAYNAKFPVTGGNKAFISTNLQPLDNPVVAGTTPVDNKLKQDKQSL